MPAGKSSERLAEEIGAYGDVSPPLFALNPVEVYKKTSVEADTPLFAGFVVPGLPTPPLEFEAYYALFRTHVQLEADRELARGAEHDWHIADRSKDGRVTVLQCSVTGAQLVINLYAAELPAAVRATFSTTALAARVAAAESAESSSSGSGSAGSVDVQHSWTLFARIANDLCVTPPHERRNISAKNPNPAKLLDLSTVLPFLGFSLDRETQMYVPPRDGSPAFQRWLRRVLTEALFEVTELHRREPLAPRLAQFLGTELVAGDKHLSMPAYGCLGCVSTFSDEQILNRFELAMQHDELRGGPWYLEALTTIAQHSGSELLETRVIELMSLGSPTLSGLKEELSKLGLDLDTQEQLSDDHLVDMVLDVPGDTAPLLNALCALRPSRVWQRASAAATMTPDDALRTLSLSLDTPEAEQGGALTTQQDVEPTTEPHVAENSVASADDRITSWEAALDELRQEKQPAAVAVKQDAAISERFKNVWQGGSAIDRLEARCALQKLALDRRSPALLALYEEVAPTSHSPPPSAAESYALLGISEDFGDADIEAVFDANCDEAGTSRLLELRRALHVIAETRESTRLLAHLGYGSTDLIDLSNEPTDSASQLPVGLWNIGNTCYLNSLLQFYYSLSPVRDYVMTYEEPPAKHIGDVQAEERRDEHTKAEDEGFIEEEPRIEEVHSEEPQEVHSEEAHSESRSESRSESHSEVTTSGKKIGGRAVPQNEVERSQIFVDRLGKLFKQMSTASTAHVTPSELVAYMALIPPQEDADEVVAAAGPDEESALRGRLVGALQRQQDVTECIENVLYQLEATMEPLEIDPEDGEQFDLVKGLFYGSTVQTLSRLGDGGKRRSKTERFSSLLLDVSAGPTGIYDALDNYFADDVLELDGENTLRTLRLKDVPEILQVQVQRVQFDKTTYLPYKNLNPLIFPEIVYLDRYLDAPADSDLARRTGRAKQWRAELTSIREQLVPSGDLRTRCMALATTLAWLTNRANNAATNAAATNTATNAAEPTSETAETTTEPTTEPTSSKISESTLNAVRSHYKQLSDRISTLETRHAELEHAIAHEFDDLTEHGYRIHSLFIHKGDVSYGHYWIYIRDPESGEFYKYNDEFVSRAARDEVFDFRENNLATPYFLVFVKA